METKIPVGYQPFFETKDSLVVAKYDTLLNKYIDAKLVKGTKEDVFTSLARDMQGCNPMDRILAASTIAVLKTTLR